MKNRRLKKSVVYALYAVAFVTVMGTVYILEMVSTPSRFVDDDIYVNDIIVNEVTPVVEINETIKRPYLANNVSIARNFYQYQDEPSNQQNSILYYENTYLPNSGVDYKSDEVFDVISIFDGTVTNVTEHSLLGKIVEITHTNNLISVYQSLGEVSVAQGDIIIQGQVIGQSGIANISTDLGNHLHFELIHNGENVNPEDYYDKKIEEL